MAPVLSFTAEEAWAFLPGAPTPSVFLAGLPELPDEWKDPALAERYEKVIELRGEVTKAMEEARRAGLVKQASEARIVIEAPEAAEALLRATQDLRSLLIAGAVLVRRGGTLRVEVEKAAGGKCERCWNVRELGVRADHPNLCGRCAGAVA
jgi:isoleucyl-tRNA synthetase